MYRCVPAMKKNSSTIDEVTIQSTWNWNISWLVPYRNHGPSCEMPPFARRLHDNLSQNAYFFYHILVLPYHGATQSLIDFRAILNFLEFKNHWPQCFPIERRDQGAVSSFQFHVWGLHVNPRAHTWFFSISLGIFHCTSSWNVNKFISTV